MVPFILLQTSVTPPWFVGTLAAIFFVMFIPWASWVTVMIFTLKSWIELSNKEDKTISEKLSNMSITITNNNLDAKKMNEELKEEMRSVSRNLDSLRKKVFNEIIRRKRVEEDEEDEEKDE